MRREDISHGLILKTYRGSITYGTNLTPQLADQYGLEPSDLDTYGVMIPPKDYVIGLFNFDNYIEGEYTVHSLKKFLHLAMQCNPNILEPLFVEDNHILFIDDLGRKLIKNRHLFLSKRAKHTFSGYAYSQIKRLQVKKENATGRQDLVEKFGYDTKFAMNAVRLLLMGIEILNDGDLKVLRPEKEMLLDIRLGKYTLEQVVEMCDYYMKLLDQAYVNSDLPMSTDIHKISKLCVEMHEEFWSMEGSNV